MSVSVRLADCTFVFQCFSFIKDTIKYLIKQIFIKKVAEFLRLHSVLRGGLNHSNHRPSPKIVGPLCTDNVSVGSTHRVYYKELGLIPPAVTCVSRNFSSASGIANCFQAPTLSIKGWGMVHAPQRSRRFYPVLQTARPF